jgi:lambda family phage portal protein
MAPRPDGGLCEGDQYMPGATVVLYPGEDVTFSAPGEVGTSYEPFMYRNLLQISQALGIPYAELTGDLNRTTYASSRAGLLAFRQQVEAFQHSVLVYNFLRRVWNKWFDMAVLAGALPINPAQYAADPDRFRVMEAITTREKWVDPLKDAQATVLLLRSGLMSPQQAIASLGYDMEDVYSQIADARELADELGIRIDYGWSARAQQEGQAKPAQPGQAQQQPQPGQRGAA